MEIIGDAYIAPSWAKNSGCSCGFTLKYFGNQALTRQSFYSGKTTEENRRYIADFFCLKDSGIYSPHQTHSDTVNMVDNNRSGMGSNSLQNAEIGDACITKEKKLMLITSFADCVPVLFFDKENKIAASVHSGWKGTLKKISVKTIEKMIESNAKKESIYCAIGPAIKDCCYEVGEEFKTVFEEDIYSDCFRQAGNKLFFDVSRAVYNQIVDFGILKSNIEFFDMCTCCNKDPDFFSYRRDKEKFEGHGAFIFING